MSIFEYNTRLVISSIIISILTFFLAFIFIAEGKRCEWFKKNFNIYRITCYVVASICAVSILLVMCFSIAKKNDNIVNVNVNDIVYSGGFGGFTIFDTYTLYCENNDGEELVVHVSIFSSKKFKQQISLINNNEQIQIQYTNGLNILYDFNYVDE